MCDMWLNKITYLLTYLEKLTMLNFYQNILIHLTYCRLTSYNASEFIG